METKERNKEYSELCIIANPVRVAIFNKLKIKNIY
jgi:hypothetical protein